MVFYKKRRHMLHIWCWLLSCCQVLANVFRVVAIVFSVIHLSVCPSLHQDDEEFEDDYESPFSGDDEGSGGDYESPNDDNDGSNDYEPPPSEPPEDLAKKLCPTLPIGDSDYIGR